MGTGYYNPLTGNQTQPSLFSLNSYALAASITFVWPLEAATAGPYVASINVITPSAGALAITMPPANQAGNGNVSDWFNAGASTYTILSNTGVAITSVPSGQWWRVVLTNNSTAAGTWRTYQLGAGTSTANAAGLAGAGLSALGGTTLNINETIVTKNANYVILTSDRAVLIVWTGGSGTFTLPTAVTALSGFKVGVRNGGTGTLTIAAGGSDTVNGATSIPLAPSDSCYLDNDGTSAWYTVGLPRSIVYVTTYLAISLAGQSGNYALSGNQLNQSIYLFNGILTANVVVQVPPVVAQYVINNQTSGAFSVTFSTTVGTGVVITQGSSTIVYCDGTNINFADQFGSGLPVPVTSGGTGAVTAAAARVTLGVTDEAFALAIIMG